MPDDDGLTLWVDVPRHDVALTLEDILTPLTRTSDRLAAGDPARGLDPQVVPQLARFSELAAQLREVAQQISLVQPEVLAPGPGPQPEAPSA